MGRRLQRYLGAIYELSPGQFVTDPDFASDVDGPVVFVCCPGCGAVARLDEYKVDVGGRVTPIWTCQTVTCSLREWLELESWRE